MTTSISHSSPCIKWTGFASGLLGGKAFLKIFKTPLYQGEGSVSTQGGKVTGSENRMAHRNSEGTRQLVSLFHLGFLSQGDEHGVSVDPLHPNLPSKINGWEAYCI